MKAAFLTGAPLSRAGGPVAAPIRAPRGAVRVNSLFGFGKKDPAKEAAKQAEFEEQQRILEARRAGKALEGSRQRRAKVSEYIEVRQCSESSPHCERLSSASGQFINSPLMLLLDYLLYAHVRAPSLQFSPASH